jgi:membrane protein DedA with SNARE-associated domain
MADTQTEAPIHVEPEEHTEHHAVELQDEGFFIHFGKRRVRFEYLLLAFLLSGALALALLFVLLDLGAEQIEDFGYAGLFGLALLRSASVVIPMPAGGLTFIAGGLLEPVAGIPAPIMVAVTVAVAESIGEFTGYAAGMGGARMLEDKKWYLKVKDWVRTRPFTTIFVMSMTPSPVFDFAGIAAGATRIPIRIFYPAMLGGKFIRSLVFATLGYYSVGWIEQFLL